MKLQIAIDLADSSTVLDIVDKIYDVIDIVEIGTPMIIKEGMSAVKKVKEKYAQLTVLADTKIVDGGSLECADACEAGADIVTVLAVADRETIKDVAQTAHRYGKKAMADLISVEDIAGRAKELKELGVDYIAVHTGVDTQKRGKTPLGDLRELVKAVPASMCAVAGGVKLETLEDYVRESTAIVIAGGALAGAADVRKAVLAMQQKMDGERWRREDDRDL